VLQAAFCFKKVCRAVSYPYRKAKPFFRKCYIQLCIIPFLTYFEKLSSSYVIKNAFHSIVIVSQERVFKVALDGKNTLSDEYSNFELIREEYPLLVDILPDFEFRENVFFSYLSMPFYKDFAFPENLELAVRIFHLLGEFSKHSTLRLTISESRELIEGLNVISEDYGELACERILRLVETYLENGNYHVGFAHGDFHSRNIYFDHEKNLKLLDLDCIRISGIQELDALYYLFESVWSKFGIPWYSTIVGYIEGTVSVEDVAILQKFQVEYDNGLAVVYLVDRIGQESLRYGFHYKKACLSKAIEATLSVLK